MSSEEGIVLQSIFAMISGGSLRYGANKELRLKFSSSVLSS